MIYIPSNPVLGQLPESLPASPFPARPEEALSRRYSLQAAARELLPGERVSHCLRSTTGDLVHVIHHPEQGGASYSGLQTCGSVWACPVCSSKISERRREELADAIGRWQALGGRVVMVTFTVRHQKADVLEETLDGLLAARKRLAQGKQAVKFQARYQVGGRVKALEVTHGANGWHPHLHELWFVPEGCDLAAMAAEVQAAWGGMVSAVGLGTVNEHGVSIDLAEWTAAEYVAKIGWEREIEREAGDWGLEHELSKANSKIGKATASRTPMALLAAYAWDNDGEAGRLWAEYARTFKRKHQLHWSRGLRELLGMGKAATDSEVAAEETAGGVLLVTLHRTEWRVVVNNSARAELLQVARSGNRAEVSGFLIGLGAWRSRAFD